MNPDIHSITERMIDSRNILLYSLLGSLKDLKEISSTATNEYSILPSVTFELIMQSRFLGNLDSLRRMSIKARIPVVFPNLKSIRLTFNEIRNSTLHEMVKSVITKLETNIAKLNIDINAGIGNSGKKDDAEVKFTSILLKL
ncbi:unnamed protein product [Candida verbasci]|uniref:Uncharacterized protein n=1 Tax=Candida verbasci TaxID=1227364 RepID=A0A9W4TYZ1_9ASCO|nr:unnamed protein product [Candida verbasci]